MADFITKPVFIAATSQQNTRKALNIGCKRNLEYQIKQTKKYAFYLKEFDN